MVVPYGVALSGAGDGGTHNADSEGQRTAPVGSEVATQDGVSERASHCADTDGTQNGTHGPVSNPLALPSGVGQYSSAWLERPTHNGKVVGSSPTTGICSKCGRKRYTKDGKPFVYAECARCRGRVIRSYRKAAGHTRPRLRKHADRWIDRRGYARVRIGAGRDGWAYEHRVVMAGVLGRPLLQCEDVHHINEDKQDNRPENLAVVSRSAHTAHHNRVSPKRQRKEAA